MRKSWLLVVGLVMTLFALTGCATSLKSGYNGTTWNIGVPAAKNVEILGVVHYEGVVNNGSGEKVTYDALLRKAEELGGNGIVNIMIDVKREGLRILAFVINPVETWYGSALAIKYTNENLGAAVLSSDGKIIRESVPVSDSEGALEPPALFGGNTSSGRKKFLGIF
jgi:hypothetical protein